MNILTGIQASGKLHIGNYFGSIKPLLDMQESLKPQDELFAFIASYHSLTTLKNKDELKSNITNIAAAFISFGLDVDRVHFYKQNDVKQCLELYWILQTLTPVGLLQRAHSYKDKVAKNIIANNGLFSYPVLMASDILLYDGEYIPVGKDQIQHIEMARDIAQSFNNTYGNGSDILMLPNAKINENTQTIKGTDGEKMSKSYGNTIDIFASEKTIKKQIMSIKTDSKELGEPKDWQGCNIYDIYALFASDEELSVMQDRYKSAKEGYGHFKLTLLDKILTYFAPHREKFDELTNTKAGMDYLQDMLNEGAKKASQKAEAKMQIVREAVGL